VNHYVSSHEIITGPSTEPLDSSLHPHTVLTFPFTLPSITRAVKCSHPFKFSDYDFVNIFICPVGNAGSLWDLTSVNHN
jgi:hypothetical protein